MSRIKEKVKSIKWLSSIIYFFISLKDLLLKPFCFHSKDMKQFMNKYLGKTCFIVATGPSLTIDDLELLRGKVSFSVNSIVRSFSKTDWRPNYLVVSDPIAFDAVKDQLKASEVEQIFMAKGIGKTKEKNIRFALYNYQRAKCQYKHSFENGIYPDCKNHKYFVNAPSSIFSVIQLAYYMGFRRMILLGQDCSFGMGKNHSDVAEVNYKINPKAADSKNILDTFESFKEWASKNGVEILNATRGGYLNCFKRVSLDEVVKEF